MKKDFTTDRLGKYGDPDGNFVIKGNQFNTPITTKYLQDSTLVTTPDGTTTFVPPGQEQTFNNPYVLEMKYQAGAQVGAQQQQLMQLISMYCQVVGGGDESCSQKVAQSLQKNPQQMIQQMTATIQQAQQEQGMEQEESEEDMMRDGGCIDCQEAFPQAQNLNWFYKAQGGEAFPQANEYPTNWADYSGNQYMDGGMTEAFPQAQTYLPYDRPGETRLNGMFEYGGQTLDQIYDIMKRGGLNYNPKKKKGGQESFEDYMMRMGGLPKHQAQQSQVGYSISVPGYSLPEVTIQGQAPQGVQMSPGLQQSIQNINSQAQRTVNYPAGFQQWQATQPGTQSPATTSQPLNRYRNESRTPSPIQLPNVNAPQSLQQQNPNLWSQAALQQRIQQAATSRQSTAAQQMAAAQQAAAAPAAAAQPAAAARSRGARGARRPEDMQLMSMMGIPQVSIDMDYPSVQSPTQASESEQYQSGPSMTGAGSREMTAEEIDEALNERRGRGRRQRRDKSGFGPGSSYDNTISIRERGTADPMAAYGTGRVATGLLGSKFGALSSIANAIGATAGAFGGGRSSFKAKSFGPGRELLDKVKARGSAADFAAQGLFGRMAPQQQGQLPNGCFPGGPCTQVPADIVNQVMSQQTTAQTPGTQAPSVPAPGSFSFVGPPVFGARGGQLSYLQPGGQGGVDFKYTFSTGSNMAPTAYTAGAASMFGANRMEQIREDMMNRGAMATAPITTATKTQMGSPQGAVNAPSFVPFTTEASRPTDAYMPERLMFGQMGGMMDELEDGAEVDLSDMTPKERDDFFRQVYAAGGTIEFM